MGTRSLTVVQEGDTEIVVMYRQFDGYLEGHGKNLAWEQAAQMLEESKP